MTTVGDIDLLVRSLRCRYDLAGGEMAGNMGIDYLEGLVHEIAHLIDLEWCLDAAVVAAGYSKDVSTALAKVFLGKPARSDGNEIRATAITAYALAGFEGYRPSESEHNMYANTRNTDKDKVESIYGRAVASKRAQRLGARVRAFLLKELQIAQQEHADAKTHAMPYD